MKRGIMVGCLIVLLLLLSACSGKPSAFGDNTVGKDEVAVIHGIETTNIERLDEFVKNVKNSRKDKIRLTTYTEEGDPIIHDLDYNGKVLKLTVDNTKDRFSAEEDRIIKTYEYSKISKEKRTDSTVYYLINADGEKVGLVSVMN